MVEFFVKGTDEVHVGSLLVVLVGVGQAVVVDDVGDKLKVGGDDVLVDCSLLWSEEFVIGGCWVGMPVGEKPVSCYK